jgi:hypothetical protein
LSGAQTLLAAVAAVCVMVGPIVLALVLASAWRDSVASPQEHLSPK